MPLQIPKLTILPVIFYWTISLISVNETNAQAVRVLSTKDGLPQSFVSGLVQDDSGFVWIGTRNGLSRFDGIQHRVFQHKLTDTASLASNVIIWIQKDKSNKLWIEYESGQIDQMDVVTEKIHHFYNPSAIPAPNPRFVRRGWLIDRKQNLWTIIKGQGLRRFDPQLNQMVVYNKKDNGFPSDTLRGIMEDKSGTVWVLSQHGISHLVDHKFQHQLLPAIFDFNNYVASDEEVIDLHERANGELMWGDRRHLYFFNPLNGTIRNIGLPIYPSAGIRWIRAAPDKEEYFESNGEVYRNDDKRGVELVGNARLNTPLDARAFLVDGSGLVWIGTNADGLHQIDLVTPFFESFKEKNTFPEHALSMELSVPMQQLFNWTDKDEKFSQPGYHFRSTYSPDRKIFYLALKETVIAYDVLLHSYHPLPHVPVAPTTGTMNIGLKGISTSQDGTMYALGSKGQLYYLEARSANWEPFIDTFSLLQKFGPALLPQDILVDSKRLWISTGTNGLIYIDRATREIGQVPSGNKPGMLPSDQLLGLTRDPDDENKCWIGSYQGLISLDKQSLKAKVYLEEDGLPDNTVYSIVTDGRKNLWLSTNKGLCRFKPSTGQFRIFRASYGLPGDEFNRFHHIEFPSGKLAFGGTEGWTIFDPQSVREDVFNTPVALTGLKINNTDAHPWSKGPLSKGPLNGLNVLDLSYDENSLSFSFSGLQFNQPQDLNYRYMLSGYDKEWINAGHIAIATYTKLPPGHYTFVVNTSNTNGKWSNHIKKLSLVIRPPWWRTWWAYLFYLAAAGMIVLIFINFRIRRGILAKEMYLKEMEAKQLREMDEVKSRFFSNITHEFRTPLTLIMGPAEKIKTRHPGDPELGKMANSILRNSGQLLRLVNDLMDLAKLEAKAFTPMLRAADLVATVGSVIESFENDAAQKKITISSELKVSGGNWLFSPEALERILYNLLFNALKFAPAGGKVSVLMEAYDNGIILTVSDNGCGINAEQLPHIFERFYQAEAGKRAAELQASSGTGIGLAIVKELIDAQDGKITVTSQTAGSSSQTSGTTFKIQLPYHMASGQTDPFTDSQEFQQPNETADTIKRSQLLVVEDNPEMAAFIAGSLEDHFDVQHATDGSKALDFCLEHMPDLIVSDVMMPGMDGFEFVNRLKRDIRISHIPVILLTAKAAQEQVNEGLSLGADDYLTKPFNLQELNLRISNLLAQRERLRAYLLQSQPVKPSLSAQEAKQVHDPFLDKFYQLVEEHLTDAQFGVDQLCSLLQMSRTSLHRKVKQLTDTSTGELIRNYRLKRSLDFLQQGNSITDSGYLSGFGSASYFIRCFKEVYNITPGEYMQQQSS